MKLSCSLVESKDLAAKKDLIKVNSLVKVLVEMKDDVEASNQVTCDLYLGRSHNWVKCSLWFLGPVIVALHFVKILKIEKFIEFFRIIIYSS